MRLERQRRDWLQTLGLCAAVMAAALSLDYVLSRGEWSETPGTATSGQEAAHEHPTVPVPDVVITGFQFLHELPRPAVKPLWELTAATASLFEQKQEVIMDAIHAVFTPGQASGVSGLELDGARGRLDLGRLNFDVTGSDHPVTVRLGGRYLLTTTRLRWDNSTGRMTSDQPVEIVGDGLAVTGEGFQWVQSEGSISILRDIHTVVTQ
ncbi:MAG TPA: hypothetical protein VLY45_01850 [Nitrospiria bacterium]|nr:hypothetical protein [Nitrospiria bacterium]